MSSFHEIFNLGPVVYFRCTTSPKRSLGCFFYFIVTLFVRYCQISENVKPHPAVVNFLTRIEEIIPKWKIVPAKDVIEEAFKDPTKRQEVKPILCYS